MNWWLTLISMCTLFAFGQSDLAYRNYTLESGLPTNTIYEIYQHSNGKIYVGHENGCSIFNGLSFFSPKTAEKSTALSNFIEFQNGDVICRNFQGNQFSIRWDSLRLDESKEIGIRGFQTFIQDGGKNYVFIGSHLTRLNENGTKTRINDLDQLMSCIYRGVVLHDKLYLLVQVGNSSSAICYNLKTKKLESEMKLESTQDFHLFKSNGSIFWIDQRSGDCGRYTTRFEKITNLYQDALPAGSKITSFMELKDGGKLLGTFNGIYFLDKKWNCFRHGLDGIQCSNILQDRDGAFWISSLQDGIFFVPNLDYLSINSSHLSGKNVKFSNVFSTNDGLYVGTYDGRILLFNKQGELTREYTVHRNAEIQGLFVNERHIYAYCSGLLQINIETGKIEDELKCSACKSIVVEENRILCASSRGVIIFDNSEQTSYFESSWFRRVFSINKSSFLAESTEEILSYNTNTKKLITIMSDGTDLISLNGKWYFRTNDEVFELGADFRTRSIYRSKSPLAQLYASDGKLIVNLVDRRSIELSGKEFKRQRSLPRVLLKDISRAGEFGPYRYSANTTSLLLVPKASNFKAIHPKVALVSGRENSQLTNGRYQLPYGDNELVLNFDILPNYQFQGEGELYYRIVELDTLWKRAAKNANYLVEIARIPSGSYTLEWYAETVNGRSKIGRRSLCIAQPYYFQWWFLVCILIVVVGTSFLIMRWKASITRVKNARKFEEQRLKMKALNSELVAIRSQMNPHFIFNSLSSIQTKILNEDRVEAYTTVNTFAMLLRQALQFTSKEFIRLEEELEFTRNYIALEKSRTDNSFEYHELIADDLDLKSVQIPSLFLQPFIENSIRHGLMHSKKKKTLTLVVSTTDNGFRAVIEDNGIGRVASAEINSANHPDHESFASKAIQDRIEFLQASKKLHIDLSIVDLEQGTRVIITFKKYTDEAN